ncbi:MAG: hypothetical protein GT601_16470 [Acidaminobacter sp.]|uniref:Wadjet anti-phage system protein JetD domain-containing protein n=1 Tax=Acidaminobacter sp. TaxID=1872102 RepID=UPI001385D914|nr:Wadjet anti-phage system protein JetD domain-containing protein [Acidaminobacter sp.]MZQ99262.1 hypothetical protein [Acidaminobacter sp.]
MMAYGLRILNLLVDKYEKSEAYRQQQKQDRRIMLKLPKEFSAYNMEDLDAKILFHADITQLKEEGLLDFAWVKHEDGNIMKEVWLNLDQLESVYARLGRTPKLETVDSVAALIEHAHFHYYTWLNVFVEGVRQRIESRKTYTPLLPKDPVQASQIIELLARLDSFNGEPVNERVLSSQLFKDSKYFQNTLKTRVLRIVRDYCDLLDAGTEETEGEDLPESSEELLLQMIGIFRNPEVIEFCGPLKGWISGTAADFTPFVHGALVNAETVKDLRFDSACVTRPVSRVLLIENKANYEHYIRRKQNEDEVVIYHGGFYSPVKGMLIRKVYEALKSNDCEILVEHWSDIDLGGFRIFNRLKKNIIPEVKPFRMDLSALEAMRPFWRPISKAYAMKLEQLLDDESFVEFHEVIRMMLSEKCKVEQESFLVRQGEAF